MNNVQIRGEYDEYSSYIKRCNYAEVQKNSL